MSVTLAHIFLEAYNPNGDMGKTAFWKEDEFVGCNVVPPWYDGYAADGHPVLSLDEEAVTKVRVFAQRFWSLPSVQEKEAFIKQPGGDREGLEHSRKFIAACIKKWKVNELIDDYVDLKEVYRIHCTTELPTLEDAQILNYRTCELADSIFGSISLNELAPSIVKPPFFLFLKRIMALRWNTYRKQRKADITMTAKLEEQFQQLVDELKIVGPEDPEAKRKVARWARKTSEHASKLALFNDKENAKKLMDLQEQLDSYVVSDVS
ncbi:hypothetical protein PENSPDRAFT_757358 [Peniophora sp. CONT]|nr:hypothetical protein PENSPDRAFT_757358 [Peniophora sp. CONT]